MKSALKALLTWLKTVDMGDDEYYKIFVEKCLNKAIEIRIPNRRNEKKC